ncbi:hypothetical protein [Mucilaginibacter sp.]
MRKLLFFASYVMLAFCSCKKDPVKLNPSSNSVSATIDGVNEAFNTTINAGFIDTPYHEIGIYAINGTGVTQDDLSVSVISDTNIVKGTYTVLTNEVVNSNTSPLLIYYSNKTSPNETDYETDFTGVNQLTVTLNLISKTNVQGTFSGVLVDMLNGKVKSITNGKFNVNIKQ